MPDLKGKLAKDSDEDVTPIRLDTTAVEKALPTKYRTMDQTIQEVVAYILKLESK